MFAWRGASWKYLWPLESRQINRDGRRVASNNERQNRNNSCQESVKSFEFCERPWLQESLFLCPLSRRAIEQQRRAWREIRTDFVFLLSFSFENKTVAEPVSLLSREYCVSRLRYAQRGAKHDLWMCRESRILNRCIKMVWFVRLH